MEIRTEINETKKRKIEKKKKTDLQKYSQSDWGS